MTRTAVVVGAGQGIGRAVSRRLARDGMHVHLVGRTRGKLDEVASEIASEGGASSVVVADAGTPGALGGLASQLSPTGLDVLVHSAGESLMRSIDDTTPSEWEHTITVNLTSAFLTTQAMLPALRRSANASIVLVSSKTALKGYPVAAYSAAKAGVHGFARSLAVELAPERIRVVPLCPGPTDTPMRWASTPDMDPGVVMDVTAISDTVHWVANLPHGVAVDTVLVQAAGYD